MFTIAWLAPRVVQSDFRSPSSPSSASSTGIARAVESGAAPITRPSNFVRTSCQGATLASGGAVTVAGDKQSFAVPELRVADAIILR